jgi:hypothetical protein
MWEPRRLITLWASKLFTSSGFFLLFSFSGTEAGKLAAGSSRAQFSSDCYPLEADLFLKSYFDPEDGGDIFLRKVCWFSTEYTALNPSKQKSSLIKQVPRNIVTYLSIYTLSHSIRELFQFFEICWRGTYRNVTTEIRSDIKQEERFAFERSWEGVMSQKIVLFKKTQAKSFSWC